MQWQKTLHIDRFFGQNYIKRENKYVILIVSFDMVSFLLSVLDS